MVKSLDLVLINPEQAKIGDILATYDLSYIVEVKEACCDINYLKLGYKFEDEPAFFCKKSYILGNTSHWEEGEMIAKKDKNLWHGFVRYNGKGNIEDVVNEKIHPCLTAIFEGDVE